MFVDSQHVILFKVQPVNEDAIFPNLQNEHVSVTLSSICAHMTVELSS